MLPQVAEIILCVVEILPSLEEAMVLVSCCETGILSCC
jgi:hypothetical protein